MERKKQIATLFIDKISFVCVPAKDRTLMTEVQKVIKKSKRLRRIYLADSKYRENYKCIDNMLPGLLVQCDPRGKASYLVRIELNPASLTCEGWARLTALLDRLFGSKRKIVLADAITTMLHLAIDLPGVDVENLFILDERPGKSAIVLGCNGHIETIYLGMKSARKLRAYNKTQQLRDKKRPTNECALTRIEVVKRPRLKFAELSGMKNPFKVFSIMVMDAHALPATTMYRLFLAACRHRGMQAALQLIEPVERREEVRAKCQGRLRAQWWDPVCIWEGLPEALSLGGLFGDVSVDRGN